MQGFFRHLSKVQEAEALMLDPEKQGVGIFYEKRGARILLGQLASDQFAEIFGKYLENEQSERPDRISGV